MTENKLFNQGYNALKNGQDRDISFEFFIQYCVNCLKDLSSRPQWEQEFVKGFYKYNDTNYLLANKFFINSISTYEGLDIVVQSTLLTFLGLSYRTIKNETKALEIFQVILNIDPDNLFVLCNIISILASFKYEDKYQVDQLKYYIDKVKKLDIDKVILKQYNTYQHASRKN